LKEVVNFCLDRGSGGQIITDLGGSGTLPVLIKIVTYSRCFFNDRIYGLDPNTTDYNIDLFGSTT